MEVANVENEYKKHKDLCVEDLRALQGWLEKQPHIPPLTEFQLIIFLHSCYWRMELAKATIDKFVTYRKAWSDIFANRNPENPRVQADLNVMLCTFLPNTVEHYKIAYLALMDLDPSNYSVKDALKVFDMVVSMELLTKETAEGFVVVVDLTRFTASHVLKTHITETKRYLTYLQDALPIRLKGLHYIISKKICDLLVPLIKPFIKKELLSSLHFHDSHETLFKFFPREPFPKDFGGNAPSLQELHETMKENVIKNAHYYVEEEKLVSDEKLRDRRPSYMDRDLGIGIGGSFKRLSLD